MPRLISGKLVGVVVAALFATVFGIAATPGHAGMGVGKKGDAKGGPASPPGDAGGSAKKTPTKDGSTTESNTKDGGTAKGTAKGK